MAVSQEQLLEIATDLAAYQGAALLEFEYRPDEGAEFQKFTTRFYEITEQGVWVKIIGQKQAMIFPKRGQYKNVRLFEKMEETTKEVEASDVEDDDELPQKKSRDEGSLSTVAEALAQIASGKKTKTKKLAAGLSVPKNPIAPWSVLYADIWVEMALEQGYETTVQAFKAALTDFFEGKQIFSPSNMLDKNSAKNAFLAWLKMSTKHPPETLEEWKIGFFILEKIFFVFVDCCWSDITQHGRQLKDTLRQEIETLWAEGELDYREKFMKLNKQHVSFKEKAKPKKPTKQFTPNRFPTPFRGRGYFRGRGRGFFQPMRGRGFAAPPPQQH